MNAIVTSGLLWSPWNIQPNVTLFPFTNDIQNEHHFRRSKVDWQFQPQIESRQGGSSGEGSLSHALGTYALLYLTAYYRAYQQLYTYYRRRINSFSHPQDRQSRYYEMRRVCYYVHQPRASHPDRLPPDKIVPKLCSHIIVGFVIVTPDSSVIPPWPEDQDGMINTVNILRKAASNVMISVGGKSEYFSRAAKHKPMRLKFIRQIVALTRRYGFNGVDFDWEYPGMNGGSENDKENFILLLQEFFEFMKSYRETKPFVISLAVSAKKDLASKVYDIKQLAEYVDFINLMTYDFHGDQYSFTGHNSPLFHTARNHEKEETVSAATQYWIDEGFPSYKINLGIPTFGRGYHLQHPKYWYLNAPTRLLGGKQQTVLLSQAEICDELKRSDASVIWDSDAKVPFMHAGLEWISFENTRSAAIKSAWAEKAGCGGVMIFALNFDDWSAMCDQNKNVTFPILRAIWKTIG